jgi:hypothetical protein
MSFSHSPKIVTNGLVLALDAADPNSYPGSGTTWTDMSGGGNTGILTNGPTFSSTNNGAIVLDGVNDSIAFPGNTFNYAPGTTGELTLEVWVYITGPFSLFGGNVTGGIFGQAYMQGATGFGIAFGGTGTGAPFNFSTQIRTASVFVGTNVTAPTIFSLNNWYHVASTFTRNDQLRLYINGVLADSVSSTSLNGLSLTPSVADAAIGLSGFSNAFYSGFRIANARMYNRPLSAIEILQNYNAVKSRFGL